jgi:hypothetical protein
MSKNELTTFHIDNLPAVSDQMLGELAEVSKGADFLPRIQLVTKGKYVDTGKIPPGHWGVPLVGGEDIDDLGTAIDILPLAFRPKALDVSDKNAIISNYDMASDEFKRIQAAPKDSGCMWGPTFLVIERNTGKLYELFFGNASGRNEAGKLRPFLPGGNSPSPSPATLNIRYKKTPAYGWHVPVITKCSEPFTSGPKKEEILKAIEKFMAAKGGIEKVEEPETKSKRAR